jgi:hypothetical protein
MQERSKMPSKVWVSLLWAQYNKLSEPLKEGSVSLAQSMAKETEGEKSSPTSGDEYPPYRE